MDRILAILTEETSYARELASFLVSTPNFIFKPVVFASKDDYRAFEQTNHVDMLLTGDEVISDLKDFSADCICTLSECNMVGEDDDSGVYSVFKYQSSAKISEELTSIYGRKKIRTVAKQAVADANKRIVCVCSPSGGNYASTYALALADYCAERSSTLLISFDPFFLFPGEAAKMAEKNLADVIYYLQNSNEEPAGTVQDIARHKGGLDYVVGVSHWFDVSDLTAEHVHRLLLSLCENSSYKTIVFDMGWLGAAGIELLDGSTEIVVPVRSATGRTKVIDEWKRQMAFIGKAGILEKAVLREIPYDERLVGDYGFDALRGGKLWDFVAETEGAVHRGK